MRVRGVHSVLFTSKINPGFGDAQPENIVFGPEEPVS